MTRVLALIPGGLGDQLLCFPTLTQIQNSYPDAQIDVVVEPRAKASYRVSPLVDKVLTFDFMGRTGPADWGNLIGMGRDREYDAVLYMGQGWQMGLLLWLTGIPTRVAYSGSSDRFFTHTVPLNTKQYMADQYHDLLQGIGITGTCPDIEISIPASDRQWAKSEQERLGISSEQGYVILHGDIYPRLNPLDLYPIDGWQSMIRGLQERQPDLPVVLIDDPKFPDWSRVLMNKSSFLKLSATANIGKLAALIEGAKVLICPESAPMHLAVALDTQVVAMFGSRNPEQQLPKGDRAVGLKSNTGNIADISPIQILEKTGL
ncbi:MAG: glycosyltransferase family 9 protein [Thermosynechococcaceae cyanobacterium]